MAYVVANGVTIIIRSDIVDFIAPSAPSYNFVMIAIEIA